jgi:hypothetical protein
MINNPKTSLKEGFGFNSFPLGLVEGCQVVEACGHVGEIVS